jgi:hypothetical protein
MQLVRTVWHEGKDWMIRRDGEESSFREIDSDGWSIGLPLGMTLDDAALLFDGDLPTHVVPVKLAAMRSEKQPK